MMTSTITVTPLASSIGARVEGVDLGADIAPDVAAAIREAFSHHYVLVFPNDDGVGEAEHHRLAAVFGEVGPLAPFEVLGAKRADTALGSGSKITIPDRSVQGSAARVPASADGGGTPTSNDVYLRAETDGWHSDSTFTPWVPRAAVLRADVISPVGGDTGFASLCAAFDGLSPVMQEWLMTLRGLHVVPPYYKASINVAMYEDGAGDRFDAAFPPREHPLVVEHPETGRPALFVNPVYTVQIVGMTRAESDTILRFLFGHITSINHVYRHHWRTGDLVVWDELTTLHRAPNDYAPHVRKVVRVTAGRVVPTAALVDP